MGGTEVAGGATTAGAALHRVPAATGRSLLDGRMVLKVAAAETDGVYTLCFGVTPPGLGPPLHLHALDDQTHYVLEGTYELQCGPDVVTAGPGACVHMPRYTPHTFRNVGDEPARLVELTTPGGIDRYFDAVAHLGALATDLDARNEVGRPYGISFPTHPAAYAEAQPGETRRPILVVPADGGRRIELSGHEATRKLDLSETDGAHSLTEVALPARSSLELDPADRSLVVLREGRLLLEADGDRVEAHRADSVSVRTGIAATVSTGAAPARFLLYAFPGAR